MRTPGYLLDGSFFSVPFDLFVLHGTRVFRDLKAPELFNGISTSSTILFSFLAVCSSSSEESVASGSQQEMRTFREEGIILCG
jgi:hypothetical protein